MALSEGHPPPLSPVLLVGLALRLLPAALLRPGAAFAMTVMRRRHAAVFRRLDSLTDMTLLIDPVDIPLVFLLRPAGPSPTLTPIARDDRLAAPPDATIRGPLLVLIDLLEGRLDADALFFSRAITIEGDTEAVMTLRNAVEEGEINLVQDLLSAAGPFAKAGGDVLKLAGRLFERAARDIETVRIAALAPAIARCDRQASELRELRDAVADTSGRRRPVPTAGGGASRPREDRP